MKKVIAMTLLPILLISNLFFLDYTNNYSSSIVYAEEELPFEGDEPVSTDKNTEKAYGQDAKGAQSTITSINGGDDTIIDMEGVSVFRAQGLNLVHIIAGLMFGFAVIMVTAAGFKIATSEGNERNVSEAKMQIIYAGIGLGVALFVEVIAKLFQSILSVSS